MLAVVPLLFWAWLQEKAPVELNNKNSPEKTQETKKKEKTAPKMSFDQARDVMLDHGFLPQLPAIALDAPIVSVQKLKDSHFQGISLGDSGRPIVLHFWATWCGPCKRELPYFANFVNSEDAQAVVDVYTISSEIKNNDKDVAEKIWSFYSQHNITGLNVCSDIGGKLTAELGVNGIPATFIVSPDGLLLGRFLGATDWSNPRLLDALVVFFLEFKKSNNQTLGST